MRDVTVQEGTAHRLQSRHRRAGEGLLAPAGKKPASGPVDVLVDARWEEGA